VHVRCAVIEALGRSGHGAAAPRLAGALHDALPSIRLAAAHALARLDLRAARAPAAATEPRA
jgi:HEAT repeat protein